MALSTSTKKLEKTESDTSPVTKKFDAWSSEEHSDTEKLKAHMKGDVKESSVSFSDCGTLRSHVSGSTEGPEPTQEYLAQLLNDRNHLRFQTEPFNHTKRILEKEISRVVSAMSQTFTSSATDQSRSEEVLGEKVQLSETIMIPVDEYPRYNFVGRILGPRGMTAKKLEEDTGCKIMVRGRGSCRMGVRRERSSDNEPLHVLIQCNDYHARATEKMAAACSAIKALLHPPPEGKDELKRKQLIELSIINGTYRPTSATKVALQMARPGSAAHLPSLMDSPQFYDPARLLSNLMDTNNNNKSSGFGQNQNRGESSDDQLAQLTQLLSMYNPLQQSAQAAAMNPDYWKLLSDPSMLSLLAGSGGQMPQQNMDSFSGVPNHAANNGAGTIPQASYHQYLQAAALLSSVPFLHDGSGDAPKHNKR